MNNRFVVTRMNLHHVINGDTRFLVTALYENHNLVELHCEPADNETQLGNIYIGRVKDVVKNINAAFVQYGKEGKGYLSLTDIVNPVFTKKIPSKNICQGDELLIQVRKDAVRTKDAVLTTNLNLPGQYLAVTLEKKQIGISQKINGNRRKDLKSLIEHFRQEQPQIYGYVLRTNAKEADDSLILEEASQITQRLSSLIEKAKHLTAYSLIWESPSYYLQRAAGLTKTDTYEILTDQSDIGDQFRDWLNSINCYENIHLVQYQDDYPLPKLLGLEEKITSSLQKRVWLKSGAYLIIEQTEAMWVIDVNSGKNIKKSFENHFLNINCEAAIEVAKQLRLRNMSGICIVDFIDLNSSSQQKELCHLLEAELKKDPIPTTFVEMTKLGLVEITRKKENKPLNEQIFIDE